MENNETRAGRMLFWAVLSALLALAAGAAVVAALMKRHEPGCICPVCRSDDATMGTTGLGKTPNMEEEAEAWDRDSGAV